MTNCKNCGGLVKNHSCEYCGTDYHVEKYLWLKGFWNRLKSLFKKKEPVVSPNVNWKILIAVGATVLIGAGVAMYFHSKYKKR